MTSGRALRIAAFACAAAFVGAACGGGSETAETPEQPAPAVSDAPASDDPEPVVAPTGDVPGILQFTSTLVGGGEINAADFAGTPTAFWFWAPT
jgi:hypothetical protein